ncbi:MAG: polysaccharide pyruvyl transferase family protein [Halobacteriota archaeon]
MRPKVLLVGYNGANNTGAEAKLLVVIDELRQVMGPKAELQVASLNIANIRRYLQEGPNLNIKPLRPALFPLDTRKLVKQTDLVMLVEGSTYMDTWGSPLLWYYLLATRYAKQMKKPCIAYSVDAGNASDFNSRQIRREASKTDLILARTQNTAKRLRGWGVRAPIEVTADNAFAFHPRPEDQNILTHVWPEAKHVVGVAAEDIYQWPVRIRPWDSKKYRYRWPYYYSHSKERLEKAESLADVLAAEADEIIKQYNRDVALLSMEELDAPFAHKVKRLMKHPDRAKVFTAIEYNASQMTSILQSLDALITSRYHAGVLSLPNQVPQTAIGHDLRIEDLYSELDIPELFVDHEDLDRFTALSDNVETLFNERNAIQSKLRKGYEEHSRREQRNVQLLRAFLEKNYPSWLN